MVNGGGGRTEGRTDVSKFPPVFYRTSAAAQKGRGGRPRSEDGTEEELEERRKKREGYENRKAEKKAIGRPRKEFETTEKEITREKDRRYRRVRKGRINS